MCGFWVLDHRMLFLIGSTSNRKLYDLYFSPFIIRVLRDGRGMWHAWNLREIHIRFWMNLKEKRTFGRSVGRWHENIKTDF
jgi:hypothetical protein